MTNVNPIFTFTLNLTDANTILTALQELPAKVANPIMSKIQEQARDQINADTETSQTAASPE